MTNSEGKFSGMKRTNWLLWLIFKGSAHKLASTGAPVLPGLYEARACRPNLEMFSVFGCALSATTQATTWLKPPNVILRASITDIHCFSSACSYWVQKQVLTRNPVLASSCKLSPLDMTLTRKVSIFQRKLSHICLIWRCVLTWGFPLQRFYLWSLLNCVLMCIDWFETHDCIILSVGHWLHVCIKKCNRNKVKLSRVE